MTSTGDPHEQDLAIDGRRDAAGCAERSHAGRDFNVIALTAGVQYYPAAGLRTRVYLVGGLGLYRTEANAVHYGQAVKGSSTDFGTVTVGVMF